MLKSHKTPAGSGSAAPASGNVRTARSPATQGEATASHAKQRASDLSSEDIVRLIRTQADLLAESLSRPPTVEGITDMLTEIDRNLESAVRHLKRA